MSRPPETSVALRIGFRPSAFAGTLGASILLLGLGHGLALVCAGRPGILRRMAAQWLNLGFEQSLGTWFSVVLWTACAALLALIASIRHRAMDFRPWVGLAAIFLFLSIDEMLSLHEFLSLYVQANLNTRGFLFYAWVIPYLGLLALLSLLYLRFFLALPPATRRHFVAAALAFVIGAAGFEMLESARIQALGHGDFVVNVYIGVEEVLEMSGLAIFLHGLLGYLTRTLGVESLALERRAPRATTPPT